MQPITIYTTATHFCIQVPTKGRGDQLIRIPITEPQRLITLLLSKAPKAPPPEVPAEYDPAAVAQLLAERAARAEAHAIAHHNCVTAKRLRRLERLRDSTERTKAADELLEIVGLL